MESAPGEASLCDLLIVGAGPAGLLAAAWAAKTGIKARVLEKRSSLVTFGQADGLQARTLEIAESFGIVDKILPEACVLVESVDWSPDAAGVIRRMSRRPGNTPGLSRYHECGLRQGKIQNALIKCIEQNSSIQIERGVCSERLELDISNVQYRHAYPIKMQVSRSNVHSASRMYKAGTSAHGLHDGEDGINGNGNFDNGSLYTQANVETIRAKFLIGCDGAHSWVRQQLHIAMEGELTDITWGVLDILPITDFPDIRHRCAIHSLDSGSIMIIPREKGLVRFYIQLQEIEKGVKQRIDRANITPELILKAARQILQPYKLSYHTCEWWTVYQIGQRVAERFSVADRIFLAGDAAHTHSPKAGQGMNVSMQDTYNLGWKLALVLKGQADPSILQTYDLERRPVAQKLIDFDRTISRLFSGRPAKDANDTDGVSLEDFQQAYRANNLFACGLYMNYSPSAILAKPPATSSVGTDPCNGTEEETRRLTSKPELATNTPLGERFPSHQVLNQSDGRPWQFAHFLPSDGRFRIILFSGNLLSKPQHQRILDFACVVSKRDSCLHSYNPPSQPPRSVIDLLMLHSSPRTEIELLDLPDVFHPFDEKRGYDYDKVFVDDVSYHHGHGRAYECYGVDSERGGVVIVRPDQHVAWIGEIEDTQAMERYFAGFLIPQGKVEGVVNGKGAAEV